MAAPPAIARVVVDSPLPQLDRLFDYAVPAALLERIGRGVRVRVPLRSAGRIADAFVVAVAAEADYTGALSEIDGIVSEVPVLAPEVWALARRVADRAAGNASDVIRLAVPKRQARVETAWLAEAAASTTGSRSPVEPVRPVEVAEFPAGAIAAAISSGQRLAVNAVPRVAQLPSGHWVGHWATTMAAAASNAVHQGGSAILSVPDYRDQEQLMAALNAVLPPERIVHLDARQSNPDRYKAHLQCLGTTPLAIVGNRSVIYAPAVALRLIAVWDDGDPLHAEPLSPYVHTRDAALVRQEQQGCALWFVGHARSTEVQRLVEIGFLGELESTRRHSPKVVPTAHQAQQDHLTATARIPSSAWRQTQQALDAGPVLVQVARPGYAPRLACAACSGPARCARCAGPLATATSGAVPACGWCGVPAAAWTCPACGGNRLALLGQGSVRTADELGRAFPGIRVIVADGDHPILTVEATPALVVATRGAEPIAAGGYRAVLLLDGERMLARESLRVGEDCLRWWSNAAALAARDAPVILVGVGGALATALGTWRLSAYAATELADRRRLRFPPAVRVATLMGPAGAVEKALSSVAVLDGVDSLGPVEVDGGGVRAIVRFDYARGGAVASALRAEVIAGATARRTRVPGTPHRPSLPTLKVRFDDSEPFAP